MGPSAEPYDPGMGMGPSVEPYDPDMGMAPAAEPGQPAATPPPPVTPSPAPSPPPPPSISSWTDYVVPETSVTAVDGVEGYTTYRLAMGLVGDAASVYTIFGQEGSPLSIPAAYQVATPFGSLFGGVNPVMFGAISESAYDSWLTVGVTTGSIDELSVVGLDLEAWTESTGIESPDGALFWMTPTDAPAGHSVVAQLTVPTGTEWTVTMGAQGISTSGRVYDES